MLFSGRGILKEDAFDFSSFCFCEPRWLISADSNSFRLFYYKLWSFVWFSFYGNSSRSRLECIQWSNADSFNFSMVSLTSSFFDRLQSCVFRQRFLETLINWFALPNFCYQLSLPPFLWVSGFSDRSISKFSNRLKFLWRNMDSEKLWDSRTVRKCFRIPILGTAEPNFNSCQMLPSFAFWMPNFFYNRNILIYMQNLVK